MNADPSLQERWLWLAGSIALAVLVSWTRWLLDGYLARTKQEPSPKTFTQWLNALRTWPGLPWIAHAFRLIYAIGIPAAALLGRGALRESGLGLQPFPWSELTGNGAAAALWQDWMQDMIRAAGLMAIGLVVVLLAHRATPGKREKKRHDFVLAMREALIFEPHWAFYREPFVLLWGIETGTWLGLLPVIVEALAKPDTWQGLKDSEIAPAILERAGLAVLSALLFLTTQNLWVAIAADSILGWILGL
ncbi:MAG: hypothetical protein JXB35_09630 [Anaerolineae bacterium]|nr:hypothetical protein [Anaerolineae bacterium]